jgi:hypothetical protein
MRRRKRWSGLQEARLAPGLRTLTYVACTSPVFGLAISAVKAAKHPNQKNDRQWNAEEP